MFPLLLTCRRVLKLSVVACAVLGAAAVLGRAHASETAPATNAAPEILVTASRLPAEQVSLAKYPAEVARYRAGEEKVFGWLMGQVMRETKGKGNPVVVRELLEKALRQ